MTDPGIEGVLDRIEAAQPRLRAFVRIADRDDLAAQAGNLAYVPPGPLRGCAVAVKDLIDTSDMPTAYGSALYRTHRPVRDAAIVAMLRRAGALVVGKTATSEFATWRPTDVTNPRAPDHTPGGSSAGSAAAVAAGLVPLALGTQTLGSIIRPASYCGVVGFKPSFGRLPVDGVKPLAESLDTVGLIGRSVAAVAAGYAVLAQADPPRIGVRRPHLAVVRRFGWTQPDADADQALEAALDIVRHAGATVTELAIGDELAPLDAAVQLVHRFEMGRSLLPDLQKAHGGLDAELASAIEQGGKLRADRYQDALMALEAGRTAFATTMAGYDALLCLAATGEAPRGRSTTGDPAMNRVWTGLHAPCVTIPVLRGANGLPIGLQVIGARYADLPALRVAHWLEARLRALHTS